MKKLSLLLLTFVMARSAFAEYNIIDRYKITDDRFKTEAMLRPFGHDFLLDINAAVNVKFLDLIDDASKISDGGDNESSKESQAQELFQQYANNELTTRFGLNVGVPIFSFTAWGVKVVPDLRLSTDVGAKIAIREEAITVDTLIDLFGNELSASQRAEISSKGNQAITDINGAPHNGNVTSYLESEGIITSEEAAAIGEVKIPDENLPDLFGYVKGDVKLGMLFNLSKDVWMGHVNLYGMARADYFKRFTASDIARDRGIGDGFDETNEQIFAVTDLMLGYKWRETYTFKVSVEELKLATISDKISEAGDLNYKVKPLLRFHSDASFKYMLFTLNPFVGIHKREGYGLDEGFYAGSDFWMTVWGDRIGLRLRGMIDPEHFTFSPLVKLWLMQIEYSLKVPVKSTVEENIKVATFHSLDFRLFF